MVTMMRFRDSLRRTMTRMQPLAAWLARLSSTAAARQPAANAPGAYALLAGIEHSNE